MDLQLFLFLSALGFASLCLLLSDSFGVVTHDFQIFITLLSEFLLFAIEGDLVSDLNLLDHLLVADPLGLCGSDVQRLLLLDGPHHLLLLALKLLTFLDSLDFSLFDLLDDNGCTAALGLHSQSLSFILSFQCLQTLDFHHQIKAFLLIDPFLLELFVLVELLVTHRDDFGVERHLVHVLHVVVLLVELLLRLGEQTLRPLVLLNLNLSRWQLRASVTVHLDHFLLASLGSRLLLCFLLLHDLLLVFLLLLSLNLGRSFHTGDIGRRDNGCCARRTLASLFNVSTHRSQLVVVHNGDILIGRLCCSVY